MVDMTVGELRELLANFDESDKVCLDTDLNFVVKGDEKTVRLELKRCFSEKEETRVAYIRKALDEYNLDEEKFLVKGSIEDFATIHARRIDDCLAYNSMTYTDTGTMLYDDILHHYGVPQYPCDNDQQAMKDFRAGVDSIMKTSFP